MVETVSTTDAVFYYGIAVGILGAIAQFVLTSKVKGKTSVDSNQLFFAIAVAGIATIVAVGAIQPKA